MDQHHLIHEVSETIKKPIHWAYRVLAGLGWFALTIIGILAALLIAINTTTAQTWLTNKLGEYLRQNTGYPITVGYANISWFNAIQLENIVALDHQNDTIVNIGHIELKYDFNELLLRNGVINSAVLANTLVVSNQAVPKGKGTFDDLIVKIIELTSSGTPVKKNKVSSFFTLNEVQLQNCRFKLNMMDEKPIKGKLDYYHLDFGQINGSVNTLRFRDDTTFVGVEHLSAIELKSKTTIERLTTKFFICSKRMEFDKLYAHIGSSLITNYLRFDYSSYDDFSDFNNKVVITSKLQNAQVAWADLRRLFAPTMPIYPDLVRITGKVKGSVDNLNLLKCKFEIGKESYASCNATLKGLPDWENMKINLLVHKSNILTEDMRGYLAKSDYEEIKKYKFANVSGTLKGKFDDFHTISLIKTGLGEVHADIDLLLKNRPAQYKYEGALATKDLQIGAIANNDKLQNLTMLARIKGTGLTLESVNARLEANVQNIGVNNYNYRNIELSATLAKQLFNGRAQINDPNIAMRAEGVVNLNKEIELIDVKTTIDKANINALGIAGPVKLLKTHANIKLKYFDIDRIHGSLHFANSTIGFANDTIQINRFNAVSTWQTGGQREISVLSDLGNVSAKGKFTFTQLVKDIPSAVEEYVTDLNGNAKLKPNKQHYTENDIEISATVFELNPLLTALKVPFAISEGSELTGNIATGVNNVFQFTLLSDSLKINNFSFFNNEFEVSTSRTNKTGYVVGSAYVSSKSQSFSTKLKTENLLIDGSWTGKEIDLRGKINQVNTANFIKLNTAFHLMPQKTELKILPSIFHFAEQDWNIADSNLITFLPGRKAGISKLSIENANTSFTIDGIAGEYPEDVLNVEIAKLDLSSLNSFIAQPIFGIAHGNIKATAILKKYNLTTQFNIDSLRVKDIYVGNIEASAAFDSLQNSLGINAKVEQFGKNIAMLNGDYKIGDDKPIRFVAKLNQAPINILQPYVEGIVTGLDGKATGNVNLGGSLTALELSGSIDVKGGQLVLPYTGVKYFFNHSIDITPTYFSFSGAKVTDFYGNQGIISRGFVGHNFFDNWVVNIKADYKKLQVLNLPPKENVLYYGQAFATGTLSLTGPADDLVLSADAVTNSGSKMFLPISNKKNAALVGNNIVFTNSKKLDTITFNGKSKNLMNRSGIAMEFNVDITPETEMEIIFDERSGEKIKVKGQGRMKMQYDTRSDMALYGQYTINSGTYNFTLSNAINKKFNIQPGSTISWSGNPWDGVLSIHASHDLYALLTPLISDSQISGDRATELNKPIYKRKYLTSVLLDLTGPILKPEIKMNIEIKDKPTDLYLSTAITNFESVIQTNDNILNQEIISLFLIRSFTSIDNNAGFSGSALAGGTISELLSNQFSNWLSQVNNNVEIQLDVNGLDASAVNNLQLRLSYALLDGRLRVTRSGGIQSNQNSTSTTSQNLAGDWTLEYRLGKDSKFWLKAFMRNNQVSTSGTQTQLSTNTTTGATISHSTSFNSFSELFGRKPRPISKPPTVIPLKPDELPEAPDSTKLNPASWLKN